MNIQPISCNQNKQRQNFTGFISPKFEKVFSKVEGKYVKGDWNAINDKMKGFPSSAQLDAVQSKVYIRGVYDVFISSPKSDYKFYLGHYNSKSAESLENLRFKLRDVNPYEVNYKFCIQRHKDVPREEFAAEMENIFE